jgi:Fe-S cluster assembly ATP-binding protein
MALLEPTMAVLDETDSGLDIDALKTVAEGINALRGPKRGMLMITHYLDGKIVESGGRELAEKLEASGYARYQQQAA